jgi:carbazole 1,9a-dioxygenase terminal dioxygenase component
MATAREQGDQISEEVKRDQRRKPWERYLEAELGLRNYWYPAFFSHELAEGEMRGETILGERLYFKRVQGTVYCVEDRCVHRGAPFSARPECWTENTISCWFHGFTYDVRTGALVQVITEPNSAFVGKVSLKTYPTQEMNELLFVFIGDEEPHPLEEDVQPGFMETDLVVAPLTRSIIKCNWRIAAENGFDPTHIYAHRHWAGFKQVDRTVPLSTFPSSKDRVIIEEEDGKPKGIVKKNDVQVFAADVEGRDVRATNYPADAPSVINEVRKHGVGCYLPCGLQVDHFPKTGLIHFEWYVPIDEEHHMYIILQAGHASTDEERAAFKKEATEVLGPLVWTEPGVEPEGFNNLDAFGRKWLQHAYGKEDWWHRERLFKPDYIIMEWRKLVAKHARGIQKRGDWQRVDPDWAETAT